MIALLLFSVYELEYPSSRAMAVGPEAMILALESQKFVDRCDCIGVLCFYPHLSAALEICDRLGATRWAASA